MLAGSSCPPGDGRAIESLSRKERLDLAGGERGCQATVRYYSLAAFADRENISLILHSSYDTLALVDPRNDSQVVFHDALVPGGALLGYLNADHWAIALPFTSGAPGAGGNPHHAQRLPPRGAARIHRAVCRGIAPGRGNR
ncbi:MAG: hypothetical protein MZU95_11000 [Desulfomicrobium escambiense]|nr:hypothetical protein [Desulfomicrobium escambiense]